jgi:hypothetical protein
MVYLPIGMKLETAAAPKAREVVEQIFFGAAKMAGDPRIPVGCLMVIANP